MSDYSWVVEVEAQVKPVVLEMFPRLAEFESGVAENGYIVLRDSMESERTYKVPHLATLIRHLGQHSACRGLVKSLVIESDGGHDDYPTFETETVIFDG